MKKKKDERQEITDQTIKTAGRKRCWKEKKVGIGEIRGQGERGKTRRIKAVGPSPRREKNVVTPTSNPAEQKQGEIAKGRERDLGAGKSAYKLKGGTSLTTRGFPPQLRRRQPGKARVVPIRNMGHERKVKKKPGTVKKNNWKH